MGELNALGRTSDTKRTLLITTKTLPSGSHVMISLYSGASRIAKRFSANSALGLLALVFDGIGNDISEADGSSGVGTSEVDCE